MTYREIDLDGRGVAFLLDHLRGVNILCDSLAQVVERDHGRVFTFIPAETDEARVYQFNAGGLLPENNDPSRLIPLGPGRGSLMPVASLAKLRAGIVLDDLTSHTGAICICDHFNPEWSKRTADANPNAFGVDRQTYHLLTRESSLDTIATTLRKTHAIWHGAAAVCLFGLDIGSTRNVSVEALQACGASAVQITCIAYDGEGFVAWRRT